MSGLIKMASSKPRARVHSLNKVNLLELIRTLSWMIDFSKDRPIMHSWRVGVLAGIIAQVLCPAQRRQVFIAGLLHDAGAISMENFKIIAEAAEYAHRAQAYPTLFQHPQIGADLLVNIPQFKTASRYILDHHECWNGTGYPQGKARDEISLGGQIIRLADSMDIMLYTMPIKTFMNLHSRVTRLRGKVVTNEVFDTALDLLKNDQQVFYKITSPAHLPFLVSQLQRELFPRMNLKLRELLAIFATLIDRKHKYTQGHSLRVSLYAAQLARQLGLSTREIKDIEFAGLLHDIGKLRIPGSILDKPAKLTDKEFNLVKTHAGYTIMALKTITGFDMIADMAGYHHEQWNGGGYPDGLQGEKIPLGARIMAAADIFDALTSARAYRPAMSEDQAKEILQDIKGSKLDPSIADMAVEVLHKLEPATEWPRQLRTV